MKIMELIGNCFDTCEFTGNFGVVYKGFLEQGNDGYPQLVAVKALKGRPLKCFYFHYISDLPVYLAVSSL